MGESQPTLFQPDFNRSVHVEARRERLSADGGAVLLRELLHRLGLDTWLSDRIDDPRDPARTTHPTEELLRTLVLLQGQGWTDQEDVGVLRDDPLFRLAVSSRRGDCPLREARRPTEPEGLCSQPTLSRCLRWLSTEGNRSTLDEALREMADRRHGLRWRPPLREMTLDLDSLPVEVHGHQPGTAYNGYFGGRCYHPLVLHGGLGDFLGARLREGNAHTADGALEFALPGFRWARQRARTVWGRIDAGFPSDEFLRALEAQGVRYVARVKTNDVLKRKAAPHLKRPPGRPPKEGRTWFHELTYRAGTWERERRVLLVVLERPERTEAEDGSVQERLFLDPFFLITNTSIQDVSPEELLARYRGRRLRGTKPRRDSFAVNEAWLLLSLIAAHLLEIGRTHFERATGRRLGRERFRRWLLKVAVRVTLGSRQVKVILAARRARPWAALWKQICRALPIRGSPEPRPRPLPA